MSCPICSQESDPKYRPFCSRRCADLDLGNWLTGRYSMPSEDMDGTDGQGQASTGPDTTLH